MPPAIHLPPPPDRPGLPELPPVVHPVIHELPAPTAEELPVAVLTDAHHREEAAQGPDLLAVLLADERVRGALQGHRYAFLGASTTDDGKGGAAPAGILALLYDYTAGHALEVTVHRAELTVTAIAAGAGQPALSTVETERAVALARAHPATAPRLAAGFVPMVLLTSDVGEGDRHHGRRRAYVGFGPPGERLPRVRVIVDLGEERVVETDAGGGCCDE
ncbi:hypothetical protein ACIHFE_07280 [Streptomyces sp. NPDC052396]|uniref:hypothetical protein n=1 Tax=Streptomyces sp. NPDC052396 TaxID=3365689 RepID=UPI0037D73BD0